MKKPRRRSTKIRFELMDGTLAPDIEVDCSGSFRSYSEMYEARRVYRTYSKPHRYFREHWTEADYERAKGLWIFKDSANPPAIPDHTRVLVPITAKEARQLGERFKRER